jgi:hypothetical protein
MKNFNEQIKRGITTKNHLFLIYGVSGIGKTTFCASMPAPIFIAAEDGTAVIDVERFEPQGFEEVLEFCDWLLKNETKYKSVVIDSLDWVEYMLHKQICEKYKVKNIELAAGGYGKGYTEALASFILLKDKLTDLRKKYNIAIICHADITTFSDPQNQIEYNRYTFKLHKKSAALFKEFVDSVLFANYKLIRDKENPTLTGERVIYTEARIGIDAKNRFCLPFEISLDFKKYDELVRLATQGSHEIQDIIKNLSELILKIEDEELKEKIKKSIDENKTNLEMLKKIEQKVKSLTQTQKGETNGEGKN